ncbi:hypothetical protein JCM5296_005096 [Sporobolomyces johnsonii]
MLLRDLPPELLSLIISLVGGPYDRDDYASRLKDLRNCCLVSRAFRQIAQPELFAIIEVRGRKRLEAFRAAAKATELGRTTATAVLRSPPSDVHGLMTADVGAALEELPSLREVRISWVDGIDMAWLAGLPELRHLVLYRVTLTSSSPSFALPRLVQFSACWTETDPSLSPACFSAETMPSLRLAAIVAAQDHRDWPGYLMEQLSPDLASKLEFMVIEFIDWSDAHSVSPSCGPRTLLDCYFTRCQSPFDPTLPPISHLRVRPTPMSSPMIAVATLTDMLTASHPALSTLRSIHLPIELGLNQVSQPYQHLSSVCAQKGVKIVLDAYPHIDVHSYIPRRISEWIGTKGSRD